jgi:major membrane immunogen (membrane-anchored lipoprotein)
MWKLVAKPMGATYSSKYFDTTVWECINRDAKRDKMVGRAVLLNMAMQYNLVEGLDRIVVCDIDGTVADGTHRQGHLEGDKKDWKTYFSLMHDDLPRFDVYQDAMDEAVAEGGELVFVSARPEDYREETEAWLKKHGMDHFHLIMRPKGNKRPDTEVKKRILDKYLSNYKIIKVYDDRPSVLRDVWIKNLGKDKVVDCGDGIDF